VLVAGSLVAVARLRLVSAGAGGAGHACRARGASRSPWLRERSGLVGHGLGRANFGPALKFGVSIPAPGPPAPGRRVRSRTGIGRPRRFIGWRVYLGSVEYVAVLERGVAAGGGAKSTGAMIPLAVPLVDRVKNLRSICGGILGSDPEESRLLGRAVRGRRKARLRKVSWCRAAVCLASVSATGCGEGGRRGHRQIRRAGASGPD